MALQSTVRSMKNVTVLTEKEVCRYLPSFFVPTPGDLTAQESFTPGNLPSRAKNMLMPGGQPGEGGGWAQLELTDA